MLEPAQLQKNYSPRVTRVGPSITSKSLDTILTKAWFAPTPANSSEFKYAS